METQSPPAPSLPTLAPPAAKPVSQLGRRNRRLVLMLFAGSLFMLVFGFWLLPLGALACRVFGLQVSPNNAQLPLLVSANAATGKRTLNVYFESTVKDRLPVMFNAAEPVQKVEVGVDSKNVYYFKNLSSESVRFHPVHLIAPNSVSPFFSMKVCFCFTDQEIGPGETKDFPVVYNLAPGFDERIRDVTICYTLFRINEDETLDQAKQRIQPQVEGSGAIVTPRFQDAPPSPTPSAPAPADGAKP